MKKISVLVLVFSMIATTAVNAQKFAHIDSKAIIELMPETKEAKTTIEKEAKKLEEQLQVMSVEYNNKYNAYIENQNLDPKAEEKWTDAIRADKESEIMQLQERIQKFQESAQPSIQQKQAELYEPILSKLDLAIKKIANEGNYIYVFDKNSVLYINEKLSTDVTEAVKKELAIK